MKLNIESAPQEEVHVPEQRRFERKAIETLIMRLEGIKTVDAERQPVFQKSLFSIPSIKDLLVRNGVQEEDSLVVIIDKLRQALEGDERAERTFLPEEAVTEEESPEAEGNREQVMNIQEEINELYRVNQQVLDEQDRLKEELVFLETFVSNKEEESLDVRNTEMLIAQYEAAIQELPSVSLTKQPGFLGRILQKKNPQEVEGESSPRKEELENKILRTRVALEDRQRKAQEQEERLRLRRQQMEVILGIVPQEEPDSWQTLTQQIREYAQQIQEKLDEDFENRKKEIEVLEKERERMQEK